MSNVSKSRAWAIATIIVLACIVAIAVGLAVGLRKDEKTVTETVEGDCPKPPTSSRLTPTSPIYVPPSPAKEGKYRFASVASDSPMCSYHGTVTMSRYGGTAVDAAIVAILCACVNNPQSCGVGGGFFMTFYKRSEKKAYAIMAREMAPGSATEDMYKPENVSSREGGMSIGIPGEIRGLYEAWKLGGRLEWKNLFKVAIKMCVDGFTVGPLLEFDIKRSTNYYDRHDELKNMVTNPATGNLYKEGDTIKLPKLGETLKKIAEDPHAFYNGSLAANITADIREGGGIITADDLEMYTAAVKEPLSFTLSNGMTVYTPPPPSSGAVILLILNILDGYRFNRNSISTVDKTADTFHKIIESFKHGFAVRATFGDSDQENDQFKANLLQLLTNITSASYADKIRSMITDRTHPSEYYRMSGDAGEDAGTSHLSVLGGNGDAVSITSTINLYFGSKVVGTRTGIVFNDEMDDFGVPGTVNAFGIPAAQANFIKPYKRPLSSMSPSIVVDGNGDVKLVVGASGGPRIVTSTALATINTLMLELGMKEAIDYPRVHHQLYPPEVRVEERFLQVLVDKLGEKGHTFTRMADSGSAVQAVLNRTSDEIYASCDPTKYGVTDGY